MKIYEIGTGYTPIPAQMGAATEIVVEELTKSMQKQGMNISLIDIQAQDRIDNQLPITEVPVPGYFRKTDIQLGIMHKLKRVIYSISLASTLKKMIKKEGEQIVLHFHNQYNLFFFFKMTSEKIRKNVKILYTNHSYIWHGEWNEIEETIKKRYFQEVFCIEHANKVFVLNEKTKENIVNHLGVNHEKIILIDNGVNTDVYHRLKISEKEQIKEKYGLQGKRVFIQVGSVCDRKNQLTSVKLLMPLMKEEKDIVFAYVGGIISPEYKEEIQIIAKENGVEDRVIYFGELKPGVELNEFYNLAEAMVFPSKAEGFSLVVIEAMAAGLPVIIWDTLQFKLSYKCLKFSDEKEFEQIIQEQILNQEIRNQLGQDIRNTVVKEYSWDKVVGDYLSNSY